MWKKIRRNYRRLVAFLLTTVIVGTNVCGNVGVAFAAGMSESALFLVDGEELREAIQEAKEHREVFSFSKLELAAARKSIRNKYEKLLGKKDGEVYELDLEIDDSYAPEGATVQVFYHAGTEDVIFLFLNETDMEVEYRVNIDGYETEPVTVKPNTFNIEEEEDASFGENYEAADMIDDVKTAPKAEVVETKETPDKEDGEEAKKGETAKDVSPDGKEESSAADETPADEKGNREEEAGSTEAAPEEETEKAGEAETADKEDEETDARVTEEQETETEAEPEAEAEPEEAEDTDEGSDGQAGETLSKSNKQAAVVAVSLDDLEESAKETEAPAEEETEAAEEETEAETEKETEAEETAEGRTEESAGNETDEAKDEDKETETGVEETKAETGEESKAEETESAGEGTAAEESEGKETETKEESITEGTGSGDKTADGETTSEEETKKDEAGFGSGQTGAADKMEGQLLEDDSIEILGKLKGKDYATVTLKNHVNARAVKVAWKDIEEIIAKDEEEGAFEYLVDYSVNLPEGASIEGPDYVAEGEDLYFSAEPEDGYEIIGVFANGEELEEVEDVADRASASDWKGYAHVYVVEAVDDDLMIEVEIEESEEEIPVIAAAVYTAETDDAVFNVDVPDGTFEEEVELRAAKIDGEAELAELTKQASDALTEEQSIVGAVAYDISFISLESGEEREPSKPVKVSMSLKESIVSGEEAEEVKGISVVHLPDSAEAQAVITLENTDTTEFSFQADSFSTYLFAKVITPKISMNGTFFPSIAKAVEVAEDGATITLLDDITESVELTDRSLTFNLNGHTWTGSGKSTLIDKISRKDVSVTITGGGTMVAAEGYRALEIIKTSSAGVHGNLQMNGIKFQGSGAVLNGTVTQVSGKKSGGIVAAVDTDVVADNCEFWNGNASDNGGAIAVASYYTGSQVEASFSACSFHDNQAYSGGAISAEALGSNKNRSLLLKVDNCTFESNTASYKGGAIILQSNNSISKASLKAEITNETEFTKNHASSGGAIHFDIYRYYEDDALRIANSYFTENQATGIAGAIYANTSLNLSNVELRGNMSGDRGAAIYVCDQTGFITFNSTFDRTKFYDNANKGSSGGALALNVTKATGGTIALQNGTVFEGNKTIGTPSMGTDGGGAIWATVTVGTNVSLSGVTLQNNSTLGHGGAMYAEIKDFSVTDTKLYNNHAKKNGGGIYFNASKKDCKAEFTRLEARGNEAELSGGAVELYGTLTTGKSAFDGCTITDNTAALNGGGIFSQLPEIEIKDTIVNANTANKSYGGGAYLSSYNGGGTFTVSGSTAFYGNKAPNDPRTATFKISGNTPSADIFVRNSSGKTSTTKSEATLEGFDDLLTKETVVGNITYRLVHTDPTSQKYGNSTNISSAYSVGYYCTKNIGDCVYLDPSSSAHGDSQDVVVKTTLKEAIESAQANKYSEIYVCGTVNVGKEEVKLLNESGITFKRCNEHNSTALFHIAKGEDITFSNVKIDGDRILSSAALVTVEGVLTIDGKTDIRNGNNSSSNGGGAIYVAGNEAVLNVNGGTIESNAASRGGAIATGSVTPIINISGGSIKGNKASGDGGAIYSNSATINVTGGVIEDNIADASGGAIFGAGIQKEFGRHSKVYVDAGTFRGNRCAGNGGGAICMDFQTELYVGLDSSVTGRPLFENNSTSELGGAIALSGWGASGKIYKGDFRGNKTTSAPYWVGGGALYIHKPCSMEMKNLYLVGNSQAKGTMEGGGLFTCDTGKTAIFKSEGAFIAENTGPGGRPADINFRGGGTSLAYVSDYVLGGAAANWTRANGSEAPDLWGTKQSFTIVSHVDPSGKDTAEAMARKDGVVMEENYSGSIGAAIANNGSLIIGTEELSLTVNKVWDGEETKVPDSILVYLMKSLDGGNWEKETLGARPDDAYVILKQDNNWSYTWENLGASSAVDWSVSEAAINGYTGTISAPVPDNKWSGVGKHYVITLTNKEDPEAKTAGLKVTKKLISGNENANEDFKFTVSLDKEGSYAYRIVTDGTAGALQPIYDASSAISISLKAGESFIIEGIPVGTNYTVTEDSGDYLVYVDGQLKEDAKAEGTLKEEEKGQTVEFVYTNVEKTQVKVTKIWIDDDDRDGLRPENITVQLMRVIGEGEGTPEATMELNKENGWSGIFENLPKYDLDGNRITWRIIEPNIRKEYTSVIAGDEENGYTVTNTHTPETVEIKGQKTWMDAENQDGKRPGSITVHLRANGEEIDTRVVTAEDNWNWSFGNLPKYYNHGTLISYTFSEELSADLGYTAEITNPEEKNGYSGEIINSYKPDVTDRSVVKRWEDNDNQDGVRPDQVTVQLKANGVNYGEPVILSAPDWSHRWENLDKYKQGILIDYEVEEIETDDLKGIYTAEVGYNEADQVFTVTNTHTPATVNRAVSKVWNDEDNKDNVRPASITVQLLENNAVRDTVILSESTGWIYRWESLPRYRDGQEIRYQVTESRVENYNDPEYRYDEGTNTFIITNTHTPNTPDTPDTPDNPGRPNRPSGGGGNPPRGGDNPGGPGTTTTIETPDVPLANFPPEPTVEVPEEMDVPLAALPRTGDSRQAGAMMALFGIAGLGALFSAIALYKKKDE